MSDIAAIDFFTVPTATFRILHVHVVLQHNRRMAIHYDVTAQPTASWTAQQVIDAFPDDDAPRFLIRDRDRIYGSPFGDRIANMGIEEIATPPTLSLAQRSSGARDRFDS